MRAAKPVSGTPQVHACPTDRSPPLRPPTAGATPKIESETLMAGFILVAFTGALALLGVWLLYTSNPDPEDWCDCGQPLWYHTDLACDHPADGS